MPIYEYVCRDCGGATEVMQKMSDAPATLCPACGKQGLTKQISAAGFRLAGGGWYETDFKKSGAKNLAGEAKAEAPKSEGSACTPSGCDKPGCAAATTTA